MEISGYLFNSEISFELAAIAPLECLLGHLILLFLVGLLQQLKALSIIELVPISIESELLN